MFDPIKLALSRLDNELQSPLIKWSGMAIVICLIYVVLIDPYVGWRSNTLDQVAMQQLQLDKQMRIVSSLDDIKKNSEYIAELTEGYHQHFLKETSDTAAQSILMGLLYNPINDNKLTIKGRRFDSGKAIPYVGVPISIKLTLTGELPNIYNFLESKVAYESGP